MERRKTLRPRTKSDPPFSRSSQEAPSIAPYTVGCVGSGGCRTAGAVATCCGGSTGCSETFGLVASCRVTGAMGVITGSTGAARVPLFDRGADTGLVARFTATIAPPMSKTVLAVTSRLMILASDTIGPAKCALRMGCYPTRTRGNRSPEGAMPLVKMSGKHTPVGMVSTRKPLPGRRRNATILVIGTAGLIPR